jgi:spore germination protein GerM
LIVAVDRRNYASVVFIENGRKVGIVRPEAPAGAQSARRLSGSSATVREVKVYLVAPGDNGKIGRKIGCEDSLVPVTRSIAPTKEPLKAAVQQLLSLPPEYGQSSRLSNYWKGRNLRLQSVSLYRGTATLRIAGEVFVAGICDIPRITEQIEATARQFPSVKKVRVFIGNRPLAEALS